MSSGYLYVANQRKFINEAIVSAQSVKQYSNLPIALVTTSELVDFEIKSFFDQIVIVSELKEHTYLSKIIGVQNSPFENTIFLDSDTFVCSDISELFDLMKIVDIATTQEVKKHTHEFSGMSFKNIFPEFNSGVIVFRKNEITTNVFKDWLQICIDLKIRIDMPGLREAILKNISQVKFSIIPEEYNSHGYKTMVILNGEVKVIHERLGESWKTITPFFESFEKMEKFAKKINLLHYKRLYVPYLGIIPYRYSPSNLIYKLKTILGVKRTPKNY
jgi:alpha-N-acetylglucosamine transferase